MKEIKLYRFNARHNIEKAERELQELIDAGWVVVSAGGTQHDIVIVLQREKT